MRTPPAGISDTVWLSWPAGDRSFIVFQQEENEQLRAQLTALATELASLQQHDRRNAFETPRRPLRHQLLERLRHPIQQQRLLGGGSEATTGGPSLKQQLPIGKQRREEIAGGAAACHGIHL